MYFRQWIYLYIHLQFLEFMIHARWCAMKSTPMKIYRNITNKWENSIVLFSRIIKLPTAFFCSFHNVHLLVVTPSLRGKMSSFPFWDVSNNVYFLKIDILQKFPWWKYMMLWITIISHNFWGKKEQVTQILTLSEPIQFQRKECYFII